MINNKFNNLNLLKIQNNMKNKNNKIMNKFNYNKINNN